jgi:hypothetical protein
VVSVVTYRKPRTLYGFPITPASFLARGMDVGGVVFSHTRSPSPTPIWPMWVWSSPAARPSAPTRLVSMDRRGCPIQHGWKPAAFLARLSQLDPDLRNFAPWGCRQSQERCGVRQRDAAETGCGADPAPCELASGFGRLAPCFYATSFKSRRMTHLANVFTPTALSIEQPTLSNNRRYALSWCHRQS